MTTASAPPPKKGNGLEIMLPGGIGGAAYGPSVIILLGFVLMAAALFYQGHLLREAIHERFQEQTGHFNDKVKGITHEIERTCGRLPLR